MAQRWAVHCVGKVFLFGFWEGFRNRQGITKSATVPTPQERKGDFSGLQDPTTGNQLINFATGQPIPGNQIPPSAFNPASQQVLNFFPLGNVSPSLFRTTEVLHNDSDQGGFKLDARKSESGPTRSTLCRGLRIDSEPLVDSRRRCARVSRPAMTWLRIRRHCPIRTSSVRRR